MKERNYHIDKMLVFVLAFFTSSCFDSNEGYTNNVKISFTGENVLNAKVEITTPEVVNTYVKYWVVGDENKPVGSPVSSNKKDHRFVLANLSAGTKYGFHIATSGKGVEKISGNYFFKTIKYTKGTEDSFWVVCDNPSVLPENFRQGYILMHRREAPGIIVLLDVEGNIVWHHQLNDAGFKVVHFTKNKTFLGLVGTKGFETGYGNAILEISLAGDTLLYLQKGQNDFKQTIHHEILLNSKGQIVTLCNEERVYDLRSKGGLESDTIHGDAILVMDRSGRKIWKWTVFDALDPLSDEDILKKKKDWMHANSVAFDKDGNYLISFYNNGQIWKIDAFSGKVIWKFGKQGDFKIPAWAAFDQAHSVHINARGDIMFFDNGTRSHLSKSLAFKLDETTKIAYPVIHTRLPPQFFSDRMGSSYLINDDLLLQCASRHKTVVLANFNGNFLWELRSNRLMSYRAEFISKENLPADKINSIYHTNKKKLL